MFGGVSTVFSNSGYHSARALRWNREADAPTMKHPIVGNKYINIFFIKQTLFYNFCGNNLRRFLFGNASGF